MNQVMTLQRSLFFYPFNFYLLGTLQLTRYQVVPLTYLFNVPPIMLELFHTTLIDPSLGLVDVTAVWLWLAFQI